LGKRSRGWGKNNFLVKPMLSGAWIDYLVKNGRSPVMAKDQVWASPPGE
jgi:hypothetical protein